jgi:molybdate transport system ATP-binding protein
MNLGPLLERATSALSGGERQRVAIGRALLTQPRLLLMDEPLSSLDRKNKDDILPYFEALHETLSMPILYVSHDISEVERLADVLILLEPDASWRPDRADVGRRSLSMRRPDVATSIEAIVKTFDSGGLTELESITKRHSSRPGWRAGQTAPSPCAQPAMSLRRSSITHEHSQSSQPVRPSIPS